MTSKTNHVKPHPPPTPTPVTAAAVHSKAAILFVLLHNLCPGFEIEYFVSFIVLQL